MERETVILDKKQQGLIEKSNFVFIRNLDKEKLLFKLFENSVVVDDSIVDYEIIKKQIKHKVREYVSYWNGRILDVDLSGDYLLTNFFDKYTETGKVEKIIKEL